MPVNLVYFNEKIKLYKFRKCETPPFRSLKGDKVPSLREGI